MKLQDLEVGMLVVTRMGSVYVVMPNTTQSKGRIMFVNNDGFISESTYKEDLKPCCPINIIKEDGEVIYDKFDIMKVYNNTNMLGVGLFRSIEYRELLFKRKED